MKWIFLAAGLFLFFNGMMTRTFSYANPPRQCWVMEYVHLNGCFASPAGPQFSVWGITLFWAALNVGAF